MEEKTPGKNSTLLEIAASRLRKKRFLERFLEIPAQNWVNLGEGIFLAILLGINVWMLTPFFGQEDTSNYFSAPLIPVMAQVVSPLLTYSYGVRFWLLVFILALPFSFYLFVRDVSGRKLAAFIATLIVSLPVGIFLPVRINFGLFGGDGSHIASLTTIPLVCLLVRRFLRRGFFPAGVVSAIGFCLVALTSPLGLVVLLIFSGFLAFSEMLLGHGRLKLLRILVVLVMAGGFSAFWYNPKFILLTIESPGGQMLAETIINLIPISFFTVPILAVFGLLLFENRPQLQPLFLAFFLTIGFGLISFSSGLSFAYPSRFLPALGISLSFLGGVVFARLYDFLGRFKGNSIMRYSRLMTPFFLLGIFSSLMMTFIIYGRGFEGEEGEVLGWADIKKAGIWEIREETDGMNNLLGLGISLLTLATTIWLGKKVQPRPAGNNQVQVVGGQRFPGQ